MAWYGVENGFSLITQRSEAQVSAVGDAGALIPVIPFSWESQPVRETIETTA